jgi:hypothetical protein
MKKGITRAVNGLEEDDPLRPWRLSAISKKFDKV